VKSGLARASLSRIAVGGGSRSWSRFLVPVVVVIAVTVAGCGYHPLYGAASLPNAAQGQGEERFAVTGISPLVADASVVAEVEAGVRAGLARAALLRSGGGYPRVVVEVLRLDTQSEGIAAVPGGVRADEIAGVPAGGAGPLLPLARGTRIGILARAWLERAAGGPKERETGDLRAVDVMQVEGDARLEALRMDDASRAAARRLGERLARRVLGEPDAPDDGM
jgi:hypothetical protein